MSNRDEITSEEFLRALHDPQYALYLARRELDRVTTRMAVAAGKACPAPDCGRTYRHTHDDVWWPPE